MARVRRGEIWLYQFKAPDKQRPVLILSRPEVIGLIDTVIVAPVTPRYEALRVRSCLGSTKD